MLDELAQAHGVLLTTSVRGLVPAIELDGEPLERPDGDLLAALAVALAEAELASLRALPLP